MTSLQNKRALITGGARGLGLSTARAFAAEGASVVLTDVDEQQLEEARSSLTEAGAECHTFTLDVTDVESIAAARERIHDEVGRIEVLVNNAGVVHGGTFLEVPLERHLHTLGVNIEGVVAMTHGFLPDLIAAEEAHLVNIASAAGFAGVPWGSTYAASKWAVFGFSESLRLELERTGRDHVGVTLVCPGYISTGMFAGARPLRMAAFLTPEKVAAEVTRAILRNKPYVLTPWLIKLAPFLRGALPRPARDLLADWLGVTSGMRTWEGREKKK